MKGKEGSINNSNGNSFTGLNNNNITAIIVDNNTNNNKQFTFT